MTTLRRLLRDGGGGTAVEFSLIALPLLLLLVGTIEFGRAYWTRSLLQFACDEAGRYAMVNTTATTTAVANVASTKLTGYGLKSASLTVTATASTASGVNYMNVQASYNYSFVTHLLHLSPYTVTVSSKVPLTL